MPPRESPNGSGQPGGLVAILDLIRSHRSITRPQIVRRTLLTRSLVADRVEQLIDLGLVEEGELASSTGGRAPRSLRFRAEAGHVLVVEMGATRTELGIADLAGHLIAEEHLPIDIRQGPAAALETVASRLDALLEQTERANIWGIGIGLPGPVEWSSGRPISPPIMPGWDGFDVRKFFEYRYSCPVWVDNDVNMMVTGELRAGAAQGHEDVIYVKVGTGIGAGLISHGGIHRGALGAAGDIGHVAVDTDSTIPCRCGNLGCLEAIAGGGALVRQALTAASDPNSTHLARTIGDAEPTVERIVEAATFGDPLATEMLVSSARLVGGAIAQMVNLLNPSLILIGGRLGSSLDIYLATIRQVVLRRSTPLATRSLQIIRSPLADKGGVIGAAFTAVDELLSEERIANLPNGTLQ